MKIWILLFIILAVIYDYRDFQIPNWLNGIGACITMILAGICGMKVMDITAGVLIVFASCGLLFYIGCLGGGDVKLLMVCGISIGWGMPQFLILSFICNGIYAFLVEEEELPSTIYSIISIYNTMYKEQKIIGI